MAKNNAVQWYWFGREQRITKGLRHFVKMKAVGTRRKPSERYAKA